MFAATRKPAKPAAASKKWMEEALEEDELKTLHSADVLRELRCASEAESDDDQKHETSTGDTSGPQEPLKKRRRYEWMNSDDESATSSNASSDTEEDRARRKQRSANGSPEAHDESSLYDEMRFALVSNISWDATLEGFKEWLQKELNEKSIDGSGSPSAGRRIISIVPECAPNAAGSNSVLAAKVSSQRNRSLEHNGRAFIEFSSFQALQEAMHHVNQKMYLGRHLKLNRAHRNENGEFFVPKPAQHRPNKRGR
eukprot:Polyplicarium_translucidae@DN1999_c0_g1_i2.p1